jgi:diphthamide biosynthesis protein 3
MADDENLSIYDEIEIEDMTFDEAQQLYHYPCPCGDRFQIAIDDLRDEQDIAVCPSCSLMIRVIFDLVSRLAVALIAPPHAGFACAESKVFPTDSSHLDRTTYPSLLPLPATQRRLPLLLKSTHIGLYRSYGMVPCHDLDLRRSAHALPTRSTPQRLAVPLIS